MGEGELTRRSAAPLGRGFGIGLLVCAAAELVVFASPAIAFRGGFFVHGWNDGLGALHLVFAVVLGLLGCVALMRRGLPALALFAVVPSLAVAAAVGGFWFYLAIREMHPGSSQPVRPHATLGTWAAFAIALVGAVLVVRALPRIAAMVVVRRDAATAVGAIVCAAALTVALLLNRYEIFQHRFGALFFGLGLADPLDSVAVLAQGIIVLVAVGAAGLTAAALGRTRAASLLLISSAFGALLVDNFWFESRGPHFSYLPAYWLLVVAASASVLLAAWCWLGDRRSLPPASARDPAALIGS